MRVIELDDGRGWACRHGMTQFDQHEHLDDAVAHVRELARSWQPATVFVHYADGVIERMSQITVPVAQ